MKSIVKSFFSLNLLLTAFINVYAKEIFSNEFGDMTVKVKYTKNVLIGTMSDTNGEIIEARYERTRNKTGWNSFYVHKVRMNSLERKKIKLESGKSSFSDEDLASGAGYLEGLLTANDVYEHWYNTRKSFCEGMEKICAKIGDFISMNYLFIQEYILKYSHESKFWHQVNLYNKQILGLANGYDDARSRYGLPSIPVQEFLYMNYEGDLFDLIDVFKNSTTVQQLYGDGHGSAIIKLLPEYKDLYASQNVWYRYNAMNRVIKRYSLHYHILPNSTKYIPGKVITFSSFPGKINSLDSYYLISNGLTVMGSKIGNNNLDLWKNINLREHAKLVLQSVSVMVANRLATNGKSWSEIFKANNSGTYCNQWMIVNYKKFQRGKRPRNGLLWITEQIPHRIIAHDQTKVLIKQKYWPSYNIPYYDEISKTAGYANLTEKYGDWFSYTKSPRAKMMKRDHAKIKNTDSLMSFMRYNKYKTDPLSRCRNCTPPYTASAAISARHDLNLIDGQYPADILAYRVGGAIDAKLTNSSLQKRLKFVAVSGPPAGADLPVFKWSALGNESANIPHLGLPDEWNFKPIVTKDWLR